MILERYNFQEIEGRIILSFYTCKWHVCGYLTGITGRYAGLNPEFPIPAKGANSVQL